MAELGVLFTPLSQIHLSRMHPVELAVGEAVKVLLDGHEQPGCSLGTSEVRGEGDTGDAGPGSGVWGGYGSKQAGIVEAPNSCVAVLAD